MILTLSSERVRNTVFTDENGLPVFKSDTPFVLGVRTTTISRQKIQTPDEVAQEDPIEVMGYIDWHIFGSSKFRIGGKVLESNIFLPSHGFFGSKRTFNGPDERPYRWDMHVSNVTLSLDDGSETVIATYYRANLGIIGKRTSARLEIMPEAEHMLDLIVLTFKNCVWTRREGDTQLAVRGAPEPHVRTNVVDWLAVSLT